ncbi:MAG: MarR family winged helix-turn-helix transcriptional regulator [Aggregatilineales bacterium]
MEITEINEQELQTWLVVLRATHWLDQQLARDMMKEDKVRINWYDVLIHLQHAPDSARGMRMQDLIDRVIISNSGMTRLIDRLVEEGLVVRQMYDDDRREVYVTITEAGRKMVTQLMQNHQKRIKKYFLDYVHDDEMDVIKAVFQRIIESNSCTPVE